MKTTTNNQLNMTLTNQQLVYQVFPSVEKIINKISHCQRIRLVYGETYDQFGLTIDSLKYYFFISTLHQILELNGNKVTSTVIVGDLHSVKNKLVENKEALLDQAHIRLQLINKIKSIYHLKFEPMLMSQLIDSTDYQRRLNIITPIFQNSAELKNIAKKTVLKNRITQEEEVGYQYTLEEVALITGYDLKIGPPREIYYDQMARTLGPKVNNDDFCSLYLKPTYPIGLNFDYFVTHPEIEEFGVTPYKAGSNRLQNHRIILETTNLKNCMKLISSSFMSLNQSLPNPVFDVYLISNMAKQLRNSNTLFDLKVEIGSNDEFKQKTFQLLSENIYQPLGLK